MGALLVQVLRVGLTLLSGIGIGAMVDKVAGDKLPYYPKDGAVAPVTKDSSGNFAISKILWFVAVTVIGTLIVKFIGKKLNIKILK